MKKFGIYMLMLLLVAGGSFVAGSRYTRKGPLEKTPVMLEARGHEEDRPPGTVSLSPERQQAIGVQVGPVEKKGLAHTIRGLGRVAADENRIHRLVAPTEGWVVELDQGTTGSLVTKGQLLCKISGRDVFNRDIISGQQAFFLALNNLDLRKRPDQISEEQMAAANQQLLTAEKNLMAVGMGETQIEELKRTRKMARDIEIRSPVSGFILARNVSPSLRFDRNLELYRIADLSRVWILADIFEQEAEYFKPGLPVRISSVNLKKTYTAVVSSVPPLFDAASRTFKLRLELDNPGFILKPDMFVDVELPVSIPPVITVPADAILDSGLKKTVFVEKGTGFFEPRPVKTGRRFGSRVEVLKGLNPGERIVLSGTFLLDSETRMDLAAAGVTESLSLDPACGQEISIRKAQKAGLHSAFQGKVYYFVSEECRERFLKNPGRYVSPPAGSAVSPANSPQ
jgi:membrane fusion protein, copper/silver efflux system